MWLEENVPEGLAVFTLPEHHRKRLRTSNPIERSVQQELKRRTVKVRVFPGEDALLRLVSAVLVEIDEKWASEQRPTSNGNAKMREPSKQNLQTEGRSIPFRLQYGTYAQGARALAGVERVVELFVGFQKHLYS